MAGRLFDDTRQVRDTHRCPVCKDKRWTRNEHGEIERCDCLRKEKMLTDLSKIGYSLKEPAIYPDVDDWKDRTFILQGEIKTSMQVVAGLFHWEVAHRQGVSAWMVPAYTFVDVFFGKDELHKSVQDFVHYTYLAIILGWGDVTNKFAPQLIRQVIELRELRGKTTVLLTDKKRVGVILPPGKGGLLIKILESIAKDSFVPVDNLISLGVREGT